MRILHQSQLATVVLGDATDPATIAAAPTADMLCTDPPYGVNWQSGRRLGELFDVLAGDDGTIDVPAVLGAWTRRLRTNRHAYVFGYTPDQLADPMRLGGTAELVWDRAHINGGNLELPWAPSWEPITFGVHTPGPAARAQGGGRLAARLRRGRILTHPRKNSGQVNRHPTEKPVGLMAELVESSSVRGDLVVDPFAGVGSTLVAAILTGRRAYGVELDPTYAHRAVARVRAAEEAAAQAARI